MQEAIYILSGSIATLVVFFFLRDFIVSQNIIRENYSGRKIPVLGGLVLVIAILGTAAIINAFPNIETSSTVPVALMFVSLGFSFLGLLDDLCGDKSSQGFKGHITAILSGKLTTGALKLFGGPIVAFIALSSSISDRGYLEVLIAALTIALFANTFNLLDLAPGRTTKYSLIVLVLLTIFSNTSYFVYLLIGSLAVSLVLDLREKYMLGDIGSNFIGSAIGFSFVASAEARTVLIVFICLVVLNVVSEIFSYSKIIYKFIPLRYFDFLGQNKARIEWVNAKYSQ